MWVRAEVLEHGTLHVGAWSDVIVSACAASPAQEESSVGKGLGSDKAKASAAVVPSSVETRAFQTLGDCLRGLPADQLADWLVRGDVAPAASVLFQACKEQLDDKAPRLQDCRGLVQIFSALEKIQRVEDRERAAAAGEDENEAKGYARVFGEFSLFFMLQVWRNVAHMDMQSRKELTKWPATNEGAEEAGEESFDPPQLRSPRGLALDSIAGEPLAHFEFVSGHLPALCWVLALGETDLSLAAFLRTWDTQCLNSDKLGALSFLLTDATVGGPLAGYPAGASVRCADLVEQLRSALQLNPAVNPVLSRGSELAPERKAGPGTVRDASDSAAAGAEPGADAASPSRSSSPSAPAVPTADSVLVVANTRKRTVVEHDTGSAPLLDKTVVFNAAQAYVYALRPSRFVRIVGCRNTTVVLGPCVGIVTVEHCSRVRVIGITRHLSVANCYDSVFHVHTCAGSPLLSGECSALQFGPFNTYYPRLSEHLRLLAGAEQTDPSQPQWAEPVDITTSTSEGGCVPSSVIPPEQFTPFVVPFQDASVAEPCVQNPLQLPAAYSAALQAKISTVERLVSRVAETAAEGGPCTDSGPGLDPAACKAQLDKAIQGSFRDWLLKTGNVQQVLQLLNNHNSSNSTTPTTTS